MKQAIGSWGAAAVLLLGLAACQKTEQDAQPAASAVPAVRVNAPTDNNPEGWKAYLKQELAPYIDRRFKRPYSYLIPKVDPAATDAAEQQRQYDAQLENVQNAMGRGVQAGTMLAFGGPDSKRVGDVIVESFKLAGPKSLKGVRVVVIAKPEEKERILAAVAPTGAEAIWIDMQ